MKNINIFIPAAGLGERLRPITDHIPKPLLPILGRPVLQLILEKVSSLPLHKIGINLHHKNNQINDCIKHTPYKQKVELFPEASILGTGGALKNAEQFLKIAVFLVHNSDILSDIDLKTLIDFHFSSQNLATLAVHDHHKFNNLIIDRKGFLKRLTQKGGKGRAVAFTGIAVYSPDFLKFLSKGFSSVVDAWLTAISAGQKIGTFDVTGCYWTDIGTPISYAKAVVDELRKNGENLYIHPSVTWCNYIEMNGYVVIEEGSKLPSLCFSERMTSNQYLKSISLRNCILLPDGDENKDETGTENILPFQKRGEEGLLFENCILSTDYRVELKESEILDASGDQDAILIGTGGSDRKYYRIKKDMQAVVLMQCDIKDQDFPRHIEYTRFFLKHSIPVPTLLTVEPDKMSAVFEDLGDISLYSWLKCPRKQEEIEDIYKKALDILISIHTKATENISECPLLEKRVFDYEHLRWETDYFMERFVKGVRNVEIQNHTELNEEFHKLALKVDSFPKAVIHRDFQSQNIMVTKGGVPRILDYQGSRIGPPAYDVVSLLWDPYHRIGDEIRERLIAYYLERVKQFGKQEITQFHANEFKQTLLRCRLQRHMQALGAYGFLSYEKGKKYFLKYIPEGMRLLKEDIYVSKEEYPILFDLIMSL